MGTKNNQVKIPVLIGHVTNQLAGDKKRFGKRRQEVNRGTWSHTTGIESFSWRPLEARRSQIMTDKCLMFYFVCLRYEPLRPGGYSSHVVQLRKSIKCSISQFKLTRWLRTGYLGSSKADLRSNNVVNSNQTSVIRVIARAHPTLKGGSFDHQNHDFLTVQWLLNLKKAGDDNEPLWRIQDHNHGKIQHRHRCKSKTRTWQNISDKLNA